jgi:hypothetical protein
MAAGSIQLSTSARADLLAAVDLSSRMPWRTAASSSNRSRSVCRLVAAVDLDVVVAALPHAGLILQEEEQERVLGWSPSSTLAGARRPHSPSGGAGADMSSRSSSRRPDLMHAGRVVQEEEQERVPA